MNLHNYKSPLFLQQKFHREIEALTKITNSLMKKEENQQRKRILLTGASGSVGRETLQKLLMNAQYHVTVFDVETKNSKKIFSKLASRVNIYFGDISKKEDVEKAVKNQDFIIHLAAIIPPFADENPELTHKVNVIGTQNIVEAMEKYSPNAFLLYSSSVSVYGDRLLNPEIKVNDHLQPSLGDYYGETKLECERIIQNSAINWSIFRLSAIMGNHKISKLMFHMPLKTQMEICTTKDAGNAFALAIEHQHKLNKKIFNLGGGDNCVVAYDEFLSKMFQLYGLGKLNFPETAFAEKNYHCGIYSDGNDLQEIFHFRNDDLNSFYQNQERKISGIQKAITRLLSPLIKRYLLSKSEPFEAFKTRNKVKMEQFFNSKSAMTKNSFA